MSIVGFIKRAIVALIGLVMLGAFALTALYQYIDNSPEAQERLEISAKRAELSVNEDDGFFTRVGLLIAVWWNSDELVADAREDKAAEERARAERKKQREAEAFEQGDSYYSNGDYYGSGN